MARNNEPLSNVEICELFREDEHYLGTRYIHELKSIPPMRKGDYLVCAIDANTQDNVIAHFTGMYRDLEGNGVFFNSYGIEIPSEVLKYFGRSECKIVKTNGKLLQRNESNLCGYWVIYVLDSLRKGQKIEDILKKFKEYPRNEKNGSTLIRLLSDL